MNAIKPRPTFQVLVMSEESRLGREQIEVSYALKQLVTSGVRVFCYLTDTERTLDSPIEKAMLALQSMADEMEREKARQRTYDAMQRKAKLGHACGGRTFGYDNLCSACGQVIPAGKARCCKDGHTEKRINEAQAVVVRRIFDLCASGQGFRTIARTLNEDRLPAPRAQQTRPCAWISTSIRELLYRDLYRGLVVWNKTRKRNAWGLERRSVKAATDWITVEAPHLRIVTDAQWIAAHGRLGQTRQTYLRGTHGQLWGRPVDGHESKYLLTNMSRCGLCGGTIIVQSRSHGRQRAFFYVCSSFHHRGKTICPNSLKMRLEVADDAILSSLERELLDPEILQEAAARAAARVAAPAEDLDARRHSLETALTHTEAALARLTQAIAEGGSVPTLVQAIRDQERRHQTLRAELADIQRPRVVPLNVAELRARLKEKSEEWRSLLRRHAPIARQMVRKLVEGRIVFTPEREAGRYRFTVPGTLGNFFSGLVPLAMASPRGARDTYEPGREETYELPLGGTVRKAAYARGAVPTCVRRAWRWPPPP